MVDGGIDREVDGLMDGWMMADGILCKYFDISGNI